MLPFHKQGMCGPRTGDTAEAREGGALLARIGLIEVRSVKDNVVFGGKRRKGFQADGVRADPETTKLGEHGDANPVEVRLVHCREGILETGRKGGRAAEKGRKPREAGNHFDAIMFLVLCDNGFVAEVQKREVEGSGRVGAEIVPVATIDVARVIVEPEGGFFRTAFQKMLVEVGVFFNDLSAVIECVNGRGQTQYNECRSECVHGVPIVRAGKKVCQGFTTLAFVYSGWV